MCLFSIVHMSSKNIKGGKHYKKSKTRRVKHLHHESKIDVENGEGYYGKVIKFQGGNQVLCALHDGREETVKIPGRMLGFRNKMVIGNTVLINLEMEIEEVIKLANNRTDEAALKFKHNAPENDLFVDEKSEEDEDIDDALMGMYANYKSEKIKSTDDKISRILKIKEKEKERNRTRKIGEGRQFTDEKILEAADRAACDTNYDISDL